MLTGSARLAEEAESAAAEADRLAEIDAREVALDRKRRAIHAQIAALQADMAAEESAVAQLKQRDVQRVARVAEKTTMLQANRGSARSAAASAAARCGADHEGRKEEGASLGLATLRRGRDAALTNGDSEPAQDL